jgi:hypothetical protein
MRKSRKCVYGRRKSDGRCKRKSGPKSNKPKKSRKCMYGRRKSDGRCKRKSGSKTKKIYKCKSRIRYKRNKQHRLNFSMNDTYMFEIDNLGIVAQLPNSVDQDSLKLQLYDISQNQEIKLGDVSMSVATWDVNPDIIRNFQSDVKPYLTPMDCFINAMQIIGVFDSVQANILRISCVGDKGITASAIGQMLTYVSYDTNTIMDVEGETSFNFYFFQKFSNPQIWIDTISLHISGKDKLVFAGYDGHVFSFASENDKIYYLDPQLPDKVYELNEETVTNYLTHPGKSYYLATRSNKLLQRDLSVLGLMGFDFSKGRGTAWTTAHG